MPRPTDERRRKLLIGPRAQRALHCRDARDGSSLADSAESYLGDHDGAPQQELVDAVCMDVKNVVLLLNELEDSGHLIRRRDLEDRRRHRVYITAAGREALARAARAQEQIEDDVLRALDADQRATLWRLLARAVRGAEPVADAAYEALTASALT